MVLALIHFSICQNVLAQYRFDSWTTDNGLPQNGVRTIAQTPDGYLWFTTLDGLVRFDGLKFTILNKGNSKGIINNRFWVLRAFTDGSVWAATEVGDLTIYRNGVFTSYSAARIPDEKIFDFLSDGDEVLIHTDANFYKLQNDKFIFIKANENTDNSGKIYQGQTGTRWEIYPSRTIQLKENRKTTYAIPVKFTDRNFNNVYEDLSGGLWIADEKRLACLKDGDATEYDANKGYPVNLMAHHFWGNDDKSLWFTTGFYGVPGIGLVKFKDGKFAQYGTKEGLSNEHIFDVFKDREGTNRIATDKVLNRLRQQIITSLSKKTGW